MGAWLSRSGGGGGGGGSGGGGASSPPRAFPFAAELQCYESACQSDPAVRSFDESLRQRTGGAIAALAQSGQTDLLSFFSLKEIVHCLLDTHKEAFNFILQSQSDIWQNPHLKTLVEDYFRNSLHILDICTALDTALVKLNRSQIAVQAGLERVAEGKFENVLEYFAEFSQGGNPFQEFFRVFDDVRREHVKMLESLERQKRKLDQKIKSAKAWRKISSIIFASVFVVVLVCGVVTAAVSAPPVAAAAVSASTALFAGGGGKWISSLWSKQLKNQQEQKNLLESMKMGTMFAFRELESVRVLVESLEVQIGSTMNAVDFALREEGGIRVVVDDVRKHLEALARGEKDLKWHVEECTKNVSRARALVMRKIINHQDEI